MEIKMDITLSDQGWRYRGLANREELDAHVMCAQNAIWSSESVKEDKSVVLLVFGL